MKANELRVGNWVESIGTNGSPKEWVRLRVNPLSICECDEFPEWFRPILLTPEILEKCGFQKATDRYGGFLSPVLNDEQIRLLKDEFGWYWHKGGTPVRVAHFHRLQNLYFVLTGEELIYNK